ncbi:hypothetical protein LPJ64_005733 [Coemansia asiatica]|uniref:Uncharacterized protein n=1 Tax=Coemansia asiatica TaxID=1052880 RepID=A0A9W8CG43_9FUNG|nr:hypothetical protein LPJ64_005733 [Coemansia asiatica]
MFAEVICRPYQHIQKRGLATGVVYIRDLPRWCSEERLYDSAHPYAHVFGIWIHQPASKVRAESKEKPYHKTRRPAAIRITNTEVPTTVYEISKLPEPTKEEIKQVRGALVRIASCLRDNGIMAEPIGKEPDMFQRRAGLVMQRGPETRLFDKVTTTRPWFANGMVDGYRKGFMQARDKVDVEDVLEKASQSEDEMKYLADYLEYVAAKSTPKSL